MEVVDVEEPAPLMPLCDKQETHFCEDPEAAEEEEEEPAPLMPLCEK